jgi:hypothetical protein
VKPEQLDEDGGDGQVEDVVEGRREPFPEQRSDCDLDCVGAESNEPRGADPAARRLRRYRARRRRAGWVDENLANAAARFQAIDPRNGEVEEKLFAACRRVVDCITDAAPLRELLHEEPARVFLRRALCARRL